MLKTVIAVENDGMDTRVLVLNLDLPSKDFDWKAAVEAACVEFCQSEYGKSVFEHNCNQFNWADFDLYVPDEICQKHGFRKIGAEIADETVNFDEQLVDESEVYPEEEEELCVDERLADAALRSGKAVDGEDKLRGWEWIEY